MIIDGKKIAKKNLDNVKRDISNLKKPPVLAVVLVGDDPASNLYVRIKEKVCRKIGIGFKKLHFPANIEEKKILYAIEKLNSDNGITAIVIQLPLPKNLDTKKIINSVNPRKDADGLGEQSEVAPPTVSAIMDIFRYYHITLKGKNICLVGYGRLVGKPLAKEFGKMGLKPDICDSETGNLAEHTRKTDILISACGVPYLITTDMVREGAIVIDAGTSVEKTRNSKLETRNKFRISDFGFQNSHVAGDVDFENVKKIASYITPPTGGIGPITVAKLLSNVVYLAKEQE